MMTALRVTPAPPTGNIHHAGDGGAGEEGNSHGQGDGGVGEEGNSHCQVTERRRKRKEKDINKKSDLHLLQDLCKTESV